MFFHSPTFLFAFLPVVLVLYHLSRRWAGLPNCLLFVASVLFYAWGEREFVVVLLASLGFNYVAARCLFAIGRPKLVLTTAVLANLALLGVLKYAGFVAETLGLPRPSTHLPIGVSFFTFQAISYLVDVYRKDVPAEHHVVRFGLYVFLFPHLIAGPIVRYRDLATALARRDHSAAQFATGVRRFVLGLAKKILIADALAVSVDAVFRLPPESLSATAVAAGLIGYALQIYFDFSGYSDMAIGLGQLFGFEFAENFRHPYLATSVTDFWRRWHISLSSWFRDYVYIPLGGNRGSAAATYRNLLVVFVLCGLWHGANWTFVVWGLWHGVFLVFERRVDVAAWPVAVRHGYTLAVVLIGWAVFRAESLGQAARLLTRVGTFAPGSYSAADVITNQALLAALVGGVVCLVPVWQPRRVPVSNWVLAPLLVLVAAGVVGNTYTAFIYFRF